MKQLKDIYDRARQLDRMNERIKERIMDEKARGTIMDLQAWLVSEGLSTARIIRYMECIEWIALHTDITKMDKDTTIGVLRDIERQNWQEWTKYGHKTTLRKFFKFLDRQDLLVLVKAIPPKSDKLPDDLLTKADIEKMIDVAEHPRDKAFISVLYESGARVSEVALMLIRSITFDEHGAVVMLAQGKTGMRRIRVVYAASYLRQWIDNHPLKANRESPLWVGKGGQHRPLKYLAFRKILVDNAKRAGIEKRVHLHLARHSRATHLAEHMTEQQMKSYLGWTQGSNMAATYVHLSGKDLDDAVLKMYGMRKEEDLVDTMKPDQCPRCKELNPRNAKYCHKCGLVLDTKTAMDLQEYEKIIPGLLSAMLQNEETRKLLEKMKK